MSRSRFSCSDLPPSFTLASARRDVFPEFDPTNRVYKAGLSAVDHPGCPGTTDRQWRLWLAGDAALYIMVHNLTEGAYNGAPLIGARI